MPKYVSAMCQEIALETHASPEPLTAKTIFFGGGTPSLLSTLQMAKIFEALTHGFDIPPEAEVSMEANPRTVNLAYLEQLREIGVNRLSLGMQSASPEMLRILDRRHTHQDVIDAVSWVRSAGFISLNLDLIFGIPGQTIESWNETLEQALALNADHYSVYGLTIEEGTPMHHWVENGWLNEPDPDLAADMYELAEERFEKHGYRHYEISNWARDETHQCWHNLGYWRFHPYLGFGAGAHGFFGKTRLENLIQIEEYIDAMKSQPTQDFPISAATRSHHLLSSWDRMQEYLMVSLRLTIEGVSRLQFKRLFGIDIDSGFSAQIAQCKRDGLLEEAQAGDVIRLTRRGRLLGNQVFSQFVGNPPPVDLELNH